MDSPPAAAFRRQRRRMDGGGHQDGTRADGRPPPTPPTPDGGAAGPPPAELTALPPEVLWHIAHHLDPVRELIIIPRFHIFSILYTEQYRDFIYLFILIKK
jgi:hypothetical protein